MSTLSEINSEKKMAGAQASTSTIDINNIQAYNENILRKIPRPRMQAQHADLNLAKTMPAGEMLFSKSELERAIALAEHKPVEERIDADAVEKLKEVIARGDEMAKKENKEHVTITQPVNVMSRVILPDIRGDSEKRTIAKRKREIKKYINEDDARAIHEKNNRAALEAANETKKKTANKGKKKKHFFFFWRH